MSKRMDEFAVLRRIVAALEKLPRAAQERVIAFAVDKYVTHPGEAAGIRSDALGDDEATP